MDNEQTQALLRGHSIFLGQWQSPIIAAAGLDEILFVPLAAYPVTNGSKLWIYNRFAVFLSSTAPLPELHRPDKSRQSSLNSLCERVETVTHKGIKKLAA
jgi:hypothetical protein